MCGQTGGYYTHSGVNTLPSLDKAKLEKYTSKNGIPLISVLLNNMDIDTTTLYRMAILAGIPVNIKVIKNESGRLQKGLVLFTYFLHVEEFMRIWTNPIKIVGGKVKLLKLNFPYECVRFGQSKKRYMYEAQKDPAHRNAIYFPSVSMPYLINRKEAKEYICKQLLRANAIQEYKEIVSIKFTCDWPCKTKDIMYNVNVEFYCAQKADRIRFNKLFPLRWSGNRSFAQVSSYKLNTSKRNDKRNSPLNQKKYTKMQSIAAMSSKKSKNSDAENSNHCISASYIQCIKRMVDN